MRKIIKGFLHFLYIIVYRVKKVGEENIPKDGAYILCGNHVHALDAPAVVVCTKRKIDFLAKQELFKNPFLKWLGNMFDVIPVKREKQDIDSMKKCLAVLNKGGILGMFPEGTRKGMSKNVKVKNGAAFMALRTGVPVIPVGIQGNFKVFTKVKLNYGKPLDFSKYKSKTPEKETLDKVTSEIMENIIRLTNESV